MDAAAPNRKERLQSEEAKAQPAFEEVFAAHYGWVRHTVRRLGAPEREADDLTHEVMLTVLRKLPQFDATRPMRPWLMGIASRVCSTHRRSARVRHEVGTLDVEPAAEGAGAYEELETEERRRMVIDALADVDDSRRAVLLLADIDGCSMPEIAEALEIPLNTGYSRLRLAREELRAALRRRMKGERP
jgi:RNA polymerase sigma-70 factor (ECF subfamily)